MLSKPCASLRERAFAYTVSYTFDRLWIPKAETAVIIDGMTYLPGAGVSILLSLGMDPTVREVFDAARADNRARELLSRQPISQHLPGTADPELVNSLQDLGDILAWVTDEAFEAKYFPRMPDVNVPDDHVRVVMAAMQRELDREAARPTRGKPRAVQLSDLPWERQCALAERRRYWYGKFGITPESWKTGYWSVWEVADEPIPVEIARKFNSLAYPREPQE